ncbi:uncharacterized protein K02A2.6-like [Daktulosphaira vitifoliae]|uniref:uncharacterized protein K02A2.6-like n=1 Tax=Daktulosphaira vitifoliae TaxID=58002 RepID=UPI0021AA9DFF|nr:uncharacterized protein K02A2.6-like [Daktulosphaira vitifoliae]
MVKATPRALSLEEIKKESEVDSELILINNCFKTGNFDVAPIAYKVIKTELCIYNNILLRGTRIVMPLKLRPKVLQLAHEGHPGIVSMKQRLRSKVWWPGLDKEAEKCIKSCHDCQIVSLPNHPPLMKRRKLPMGPWIDVAVDLLGPLPSGHYIFVVDYYSTYYEIDIFKNVEAKTIVKSLKRIFARFGNPITITCDNGGQFISQEYKSFCEENNIEIYNTIPLWPQANGEVERQNRSILKRLIIAQASKLDWEDELLKYLFMYRNTPYSVTGVSPSELLLGGNLEINYRKFKEWVLMKKLKTEIKKRSL